MLAQWKATFSSVFFELDSRDCGCPRLRLFGCAELLTVAGITRMSQRPQIKGPKELRDIRTDQPSGRC
jgi:hypothetical protein